MGERHFLRGLLLSMVVVASMALPRAALAATDRYFRVTTMGQIREYPEFDDVVSNSNSIVRGLSGTYGNDAGFFYDLARACYLRVENGGAIVEYRTQESFVANVDGNTLATISAYGNDASFLLDFSRGTYFRIEDGGGILEYATFADFTTNSNFTVLGVNTGYGNDTAFFPASISPIPTLPWPAVLGILLVLSALAARRLQRDAYQ